MLLLQGHHKKGRNKKESKGMGMNKIPKDLLEEIKDAYQYLELSLEIRNNADIVERLRKRIEELEVLRDDDFDEKPREEEIYLIEQTLPELMEILAGK